MHDPIPGQNKNYIPNIDTDHDAVCRELFLALFPDENLQVALDNLQTAQELLNKAVVTNLQALGYYFIPLTEDGELELGTDDGQYSVHCMAVTSALATLDILCNQLDINRVQFREVWLKRSLTTVIDINHESLSEFSDKDKHDAVAQGIIEFGHRCFQTLPEQYQDAAEAISDHPAVSNNTNLFKGVYGHVLASGYKVLSMINDINSTSQLDFDNELEIILERESTKSERAAVYVSQADHELIADQVDTEAFFLNEHGVETFIGKCIEDKLDKDVKTVEICQLTAWCIYSSELQYGAPNDDEEAFFYGQMLGLNVLDRIIAHASADKHKVAKKWRGSTNHKKVYKTEWCDDDLKKSVARHVSDTLNNATLTTAYAVLVDKICSEQDYEEDEAQAFKVGFDYMLVSGLMVLDECRKSTEDKFVSAEIEGLDDELRNLLGGEST